MVKPSFTQWYQVFHISGHSSVLFDVCEKSTQILHRGQLCTDWLALELADADGTEQILVNLM